MLSLIGIMQAVAIYIQSLCYKLG